jgi:hypothetical protein
MTMMQDGLYDTSWVYTFFRIYLSLHLFFKKVKKMTYNGKKIDIDVFLMWAFVLFVDALIIYSVYNFFVDLKFFVCHNPKKISSNVISRNEIGRY